MRPGHSGICKTLASALVPVLLAACGAAQKRGGVEFTTSKIVSPAVVASWRTHGDHADASTTLLVLWRGAPGWAAAGARGNGSGRSPSYSYQYLMYGGQAFTMEFDDNRKIVRLLNQEFSLPDTNVVLVDFIGSPGGPTIVGSRWVEPEPPLAIADPIASVVVRSPELYEYLRCDLRVADPLMNLMMPMICGLKRGVRTLPPGLAPR